MDLKLKELYLSYEYEQKKYEEKEEQRRIREQMREEEKAQKEFERAQKEAEEDERRYQKALDKARQDLGSVDATQMEELNNKIQLLEKICKRLMIIRNGYLNGANDKSWSYLRDFKYWIVWRGCLQNWND